MAEEHGMEMIYSAHYKGKHEMPDKADRVWQWMGQFWKGQL